MTLPSVAPAVDGTYELQPGITYSAGSAAEPALVAMMQRSRAFAVDIETLGLGPLAHHIKSVSFGHPDAAVVLDPRVPRQAHVIRCALRAAAELAFHRSVFDVPALYRAGLLGLDALPKVVDTLIFARLAEPDERTARDLLACANRWLDTHAANQLPAVFRMLGLTQREGYRQFDIDRPVYLQGAASDAVITARLRPVVERAALDRLTQGHPFTVWGVSGADADRLLWREQRLNRLLLARSCRGLRVDYDYLDRFLERTAAAQTEREQLLAAEGIRPGVSADLSEWLDARGLLGADHPRTPTGRVRMRAADAERIDHTVARLFVQHKQTAKIADDYLVKVRDLADADGRIHPTVSLLGAATGRMSMGDPPLQQFPAEARGIILADPGDTLVSVDWSQIEPVVIANVAGESSVLRGYEAGTSDLYSDIAAMMRIPRKTAKVVLLAQLYGEGLAKLAADLGITVDEARELRAHIFRTMPRVKQLMDRLRRIGEDHRRVFTLSGRILTVPTGVWQGRESVATHKAINYVVQGSAYDLLAEALIAVEDAGLGDAVYLAMHDELVVSEGAAHDIRRIMETPPQRLIDLAGRVPVLRTDMAVLGERWAAA